MWKHKIKKFKFITHLSKNFIDILTYEYKIIGRGENQIMKPRNNVDQNYRYNARKIELRLNEEQKKIFEQAFGYSRYIYNKALDEWKRMYEAWKEDNSQPKPNNRKVIERMRASREEWEFNQLNVLIETTVEDLFKAFNMMWKGYGKYPKYKSRRNQKDSCRFFRKTKYSLQIKGEKNNKLKLIGISSLMHMKESLNLKEDHTIQEVTISKKADRYYASIIIRYIQDDKKTSKDNSYIGIDLGVKDFAIINDDKGLYKKYKSLNSKLIPLYKRIDIYIKILSRKCYGSNNYEKARIKLNRTYERISNIKKDFLHKLSTHITSKYKYICIEDLKVSNMVRNRNLSKSISQQGWREFRTMLEYKAEKNDCKIIVADRWFPSSQICSCCGNILQGSDKLKLSQRVYHCHECGNKIDRDYNAAVNLKLYGMRFVGQVNKGMDSL